VKYSGIYAIVIGHRFYFGQSQDIDRRTRGHRSMLKKGTHTNPRMQRAYNKVGSVSMYTVFLCEVKNLDMVEQAFLNRYVGHKDCMNIASDAQAARRGIGHTKESRAKMSRSRKGKKRGPMSDDQKRRLSEHNTGKTLPASVRAKISESGRGLKKPQSFVDGMTGANHFRARAVRVFDGESWSRFGSCDEASRHYGVHRETFRQWVDGTARPQRGRCRAFASYAFEYV
jgi:group I intron endonuclease